MATTEEGLEAGATENSQKFQKKKIAGVLPNRFKNNAPMMPADVSCITCWIIPGRKLLRYTARIPNNAPYTVIVIIPFTP